MDTLEARQANHSHAERFAWGQTRDSGLTSGVPAVRKVPDRCAGKGDRGQRVVGVVAACFAHPVIVANVAGEQANTQKRCCDPCRGRGGLLGPGDRGGRAPTGLLKGFTSVEATIAPCRRARPPVCQCDQNTPNPEGVIAGIAVAASRLCPVECPLSGGRARRQRATVPLGLLRPMDLWRQPCSKEELLRPLSGSGSSFGSWGPWLAGTQGFRL